MWYAKSERIEYRHPPVHSCVSCDSLQTVPINAKKIKIAVSLQFLNRVMTAPSPLSCIHEEICRDTPTLPCRSHTVFQSQFWGHIHGSVSMLHLDKVDCPEKSLQFTKTCQQTYQLSRVSRRLCCRGIRNITRTV